LNACLISRIPTAAVLSSSYIFSFVSVKFSVNSFISVLDSKRFTSSSSDNCLTSSVILFLIESALSATLIKSSSITLNCFPIHEKSGTSFTSFTHLGNTGIDSFNRTISSFIDAISPS